MTATDFQLLMLFWKLGFVDIFSMIKLCVNSGSQYLGLVLSSAAGNTTELGVKSLLEPILGFGTSYRFVQSASSIVEKRERIATLAAFLSASFAALTTDPTTNGAMGAVIASKIGYMKAIMARGGCYEVVEHYLIPGIQKFLINPTQQRALILKKVLSPTQLLFQTNSKIITQNIFAEHTTRRSTQALGLKLALSKNGFIKSSTKLTLAKAASSYFLYLITVVPAFLFSLSLIREAKRKHYHMMATSHAHQKVIDVDFISID